MDKLDRKDIKKKSHKNIRNNYFMSILIVFIVSLIFNNNYLYSTKLVSKNEDAKEIQTIIYDENAKKVDINKLNDENAVKNKEELRGVLAPIVKRLNISISPIYNFSYGLNILVYDKDIGKAVFSLLIALISLLIFLLVKLIIDIGKIRFFLESRLYKKTSIMRLLFPYKIKGTLNLSLIMFFERLYSLLWSLTIVGGFIKNYEYKMIPYLLAENPKLSKKEVFRLSKEMMYGYKWEAFKLDLSFIGWWLLGLLTLGISNMLYFDAYQQYAYAELYSVIRNKKKNNLTDSKLLNDNYLFENKNNLDIYPEKELNIPIKKIKINSDYDQKYSIRNIILIFFTASFIGYSWEVMLHIIKDGTFVNRGTMFGPWLPIYGTGAVLILCLLKPFRKNPILFFICAMILAGIVEYSTSWVLETFMHKKWWDYTGYFININGRVCLEGLLVFGLGGSMVTYFIAPILNSLFNKIKYRVVIIICFILVSVFSIDFIYSLKHPNSGRGITDYQ